MTPTGIDDQLNPADLQPDPISFEVGSAAVGGGAFTVIAGPCAVESPEQLTVVADAVAEAGCAMLRGGAYKPRTSPRAFQGLGREGLELLVEARARTGLPIVTEVLDPRDVELVADQADVLQIGARNMQNYELLKEVGRTDAAVLLKRGLSATLAELLSATEYVLDGGNERVMLCERGIRTHETAYRFTLDLLAIPALKEMTGLPVIVDPSHAPGRRDWVPQMALAAAACGADGLIIETHNDPDSALCDGPQQLPTDELAALVAKLSEAARLAGKEMPVPA